ncbi:hypothetical protein DYBT9275_03246 [Dyadobacter sp. CECT 9275]|uniref:Uncharacterized protein n=1 Tax=Dyadobacter helix TaxID=2822344 RepID=A0A916JH97_9BACT|nr:hypothetical protein [Dyadobacter sp. CECT 9275]CAG5003866.1 hypothetical protein DYBT9275_03246 [Dyadobacter sp. CECT 9275]
MSRIVLRNLSLGYLLLPNLIFYLGWFRFPLAVILAVGLIYAAYINTQGGLKDDAKKLSGKELLTLGILALFLTAYSGIGGYCFQILDYWAHNSKYYTLFSHSWPVVFQENGRLACHYFGFFLAPALLSKMLGHVSDEALFIWALLGFFLGMCWLYIISLRSFFAVALFMSLGGIGHLLKVIFIQVAGLDYQVPPFFIELWPVLYQAQWAPNQLIPVIIVCSVLFNDLVFEKRPERSFLFIISIFTWGIFPSVILVLIFSGILAYHYLSRIKSFISFQVLRQIIFPGIIFIPTFFFFLSGGGSVVNGFVWKFAPFKEIAYQYFFGVLVDVLILLTIIIRLKLHKGPYAVLICGIFVMLIAVSLFRMGRWNDWFLRGSVPLMVILSLFVVNKFSAWISQQPGWYKHKISYPIIGLFILGSVVPVMHVKRALQENVVTHALFPARIKFEPYPYNKYPDFYEMGKVVYSEEEANQFLGVKGSVYERFLSRLEP